MQITTDGMKARKVRRLSFAAAIALIAHGLVFWALAVMQPGGLDMGHSGPDWRSPIELWQLPDRPVPVAQTRPRHALMAVPAPSEVPAEAVMTPQAPSVSAQAPGVVVQSQSAQAMQATQALQAHADCVARQRAGKPLSSACRLADLASQTPLGPKPDQALQAAAAQKDYVLQYKTTPGNSAYWKRVVGTPTDSDLRHCSAQPGTYSNAKDQRVMRCWAPDPKNGYGVQ